MGNRQSLEITRPETEHAGKHIQNGEPNGHAISGLDLSDAVSCEVSVQEKSEPPPSTQTNNTKSPAESVEVDAKQASAVVVSLEVAPEQDTPAESSTPAKEETPKPVQTANFFKMFKKKNELVIPASEGESVSCEVSVQQNSEPPASTQTNNTKSPAESIEVDGKQDSVVVVSLEVAPEQETPVESSTPAKEETPKPAQTASFFKRFKKKNEPVIPAPEVSCEVSVQENSEPPASTQTNNTKSPAESVEVDGKLASAVVVSLEVAPEQETPAESSTPAKEETPKPVQTASFFKRFKKKNEPVIPASEVSGEVLVQQNSEPPASTQTNNTKSPTESLEASAVVVSLEVAPEQETLAESSTPAKEETPKPAQTASFFKMFKKKNEPVIPVSENNGSAEEQMVLEVQTDGQISDTESVCMAYDENIEDADIVSLPSSTDLDAEIMQAAEKLSLQLITSVQKSLLSEEITDSTTSTIQVASGDTEIADAGSAEPVTHPKALQASRIAEPPFVVKEMLKTEAAFAEETVIGAKKSFNKMLLAEDETVSIIEKPGVATEVPGSVAEGPVSQTEEVKQPEKHFRNNGSANKEPAALCHFETLSRTYALEHIGGGAYALESIDEETWVVIDEPLQADDSEEFMRLLCQLKSACIKTIEEFSYNAVSVDVHAKDRTIHFTFDVRSSSASSVADTVVKSTAEEQEGHHSVLSGEPSDIKGSTQPEKEPQGETLNSSAAEAAEDSTQLEETNPEENPVMNFFKTLVSPTKTKETTAAPDASKDQSQKEAPSASGPNVQEVPKVPPPPPPAPPKMESKAESAIKKEEAPPAEAAAAAVKEQEPPNKAKTKDSPFGKLFRPKSVVKEEAQPVEVQVDASKTSTLEASAKPEPPPAPKPEEKKPEKKPSPFANLLKPKVLLGQVSSRIQAAASSAAASVSLGTGGAATEPKKEAPAVPTVTEATASAKVKEEPKPAVTAAAAAAAAAPDNKSVGSADNPSPSVPRKLEKRNSIQLFFKNLGQKRHSDAGVQTEAVAPEKSK